MSRGGLDEPDPTASKPLKPSPLSSVSSQIRHSRPVAMATSRARSASQAGSFSFEGVLARSRASQTALDNDQCMVGGLTTEIAAEMERDPRNRAGAGRLGSPREGVRGEQQPL